MNKAISTRHSTPSVLDSQIIAASLWGVASGLLGIFNRARKQSARACLKSYGLRCSHQLDGWTLPDAVWLALCREQWSLNRYPLGEVAERAVKKTIVAATLRIPTKGVVVIDPNQDERQVWNNLRYSLNTLRIEGLFKLFVSQYFFELIIDSLRRPRDDLKLDSAFWYNFSKDGYFVPLAAENRLKQELEKRCNKKAEIFLPSLMQALKEKDFTQIEQQISSEIAKVLKVPPPKKKKGKPGYKPLVNVVVGTRSLVRISKSYTVDQKAKRFLIHSDRPNVSFSFDALQSQLGHSLHSLVKDLLDIGVIVYMSDTHTKRERHLGRYIGILMPVRHPSLWSAARNELERTVSFLGRDDFNIQFIKRNEHTDRSRNFSVKSDKRCVCLLSGGLDSTAGAVWALEKGLDPIFVSHYASPMLSGIQKSLISRLGYVFGKQPAHVGIAVSRSRRWQPSYPLPSPPRSVMTQHLRSFLFLCLASAVALELGIEKVFIFENGPVALNPLISEARVNTRTTHPHFLEYFRSLIKTMFGVELAIENPFVYLTKGEVASILAKPELDGFVAQTNSCVNWFKVPIMAQQLGIIGFKERHDGICLPCLVRRTSVDYAKLWEKDAHYLINVFNEFPRLGRGTITAVADFLRFCQNVKTLSDAELLLRAPDFSIYAEGVIPQELIEMYRRHSEQVLRCFHTRSNTMFRRIFSSVFA